MDIGGLDFTVEGYVPKKDPEAIRRCVLRMWPKAVVSVMVEPKMRFSVIFYKSSFHRSMVTKWGCTPGFLGKSIWAYESKGNTHFLTDEESQGKRLIRAVERSRAR